MRSPHTTTRDQLLLATKRAKPAQQRKPRIAKTNERVNEENAFSWNKVKNDLEGLKNRYSNKARANLCKVANLTSWSPTSSLELPGGKRRPSSSQTLPFICEGVCASTLCSSFPSKKGCHVAPHVWKALISNFKNKECINVEKIKSCFYGGRNTGHREGRAGGVFGLLWNDGYARWRWSCPVAKSCPTLCNPVDCSTLC